MAVFALASERRWGCPNCPVQLVTHQPATTVPMHQCAGLRGVYAPMVQAGVRCKVEAVERGDWVGQELPQTDAEGRPVMSVVTTRDDGQDCTILVPTVRVTRERVR